MVTGIWAILVYCTAVTQYCVSQMLTGNSERLVQSDLILQSCLHLEDSTTGVAILTETGQGSAPFDFSEFDHNGLLRVFRRLSHYTSLNPLWDNGPHIDGVGESA